MSYEMIEMEIIRASEANKIIPLCTLNEITEDIKNDAIDLRKADFKNDLENIKRCVGIIVGDLIIYCALKDINLTKCLKEAKDYYD